MWEYMALSVTSSVSEYLHALALPGVHERDLALVYRGRHRITPHSASRPANDWLRVLPDHPVSVVWGYPTAHTRTPLGMDTMLQKQSHFAKKQGKSP
jgi:hypothetical protein